MKTLKLRPAMIVAHLRLLWECVQTGTRDSPRLFSGL